MTRAIILFLLVVNLVSCTSSKVWVNPSSSKEQARKDLAGCKYDANKHSFVPYGKDVSPISAGIQEGFQSSNLLDQCMRAKGYSLVDRKSLDHAKARNMEKFNDYNDALKNKDYDKALDILNDVLSNNPNRSDAYAGRGKIYFYKKQYNNAILDFNKASELGYNGTDHIVFKAEAFAELLEYDIAIETINGALSQKPDASLYNIKAYIYNKIGDYDKALENCNKSISLDISKPNPYKNRGLAYLGKNDYDKAIDNLNRAISIDPKYLQAYDVRGDVFLKKGDKDKAYINFRFACEKGLDTSCSKLPAVSFKSISSARQINANNSEVYSDNKPSNSTAPDILYFKRGSSFAHKSHDKIECGYCHTDPKVRKIEDFGKNYAHNNCKGCHKNGDRGPTTCVGCHSDS